MARYCINVGKFRSLLLARGYSNVSDFANKHGINRATLSNYTLGRGGPLAEPFYKICDILNMDPFDLLSTCATESNIDHLDEIMPIVRTCSRQDLQLAAGLLGSRLKGSAKRYSDWDIGLTCGTSELSARQFLYFKRLVDDLADDLPRKVDVINLDAAPLWFFIEIDYEPKFLCGNEKNWQYFLGILHGSKKATVQPNGWAA